MTLFGFAFSNLARRPARTLLTFLGIALAVGTAVALLALGRGITDSVARGFDEHGATLVVSPRSATDIMTGRLPEALGGKIAAVPGIAEVSGELYAFTVAPNGEHVLSAGWAPDSSVWTDTPLIAGRLPAEDASEVLLGDVAARVLGVEVGDSIDLFDEEFEVVGIARFATAINRGLIAMMLPQLQEASLRPGQVSFFSVQLNPGLDAASVERTKREVEARLPVIVSDAEEFTARDRNVKVLEAISNAVSLVALAMGALSLLSALLLSVQERTREIGMLAAMGWSDARIVALIVVEGLVIGVAGCAGGLLIGIFASSFFSAIPSIGNLIAFSPRASDFALPLALAIPLCAVGAAYPAWRAVRLRPAEALRQP